MEAQHEKKTAYNFRINRSKMKLANIMEKTTTGFNHKRKRENRKGLQLSTVYAVDVILPPTLRGDSHHRRTVSAMDRRTSGLNLSYLLSNNATHTNLPAINQPSRGFRTQEERNTWAFSRVLRSKQRKFRDYNQGNFLKIDVIDISKPAKLHLRCAIPPKSAATNE